MSLRPINDSSALRWGAATHEGRVRSQNEDNYVAEASVFAVADGMGGHNAGEVASQIASDILRERLGTGAANLGVVVAAVVEANASIFQGAYSNPAQRGMGTTLTGVVILPADDRHPDRLGVVNVGDSRTYIRRNGVLHRATIDHSYVQELVSTGHITEIDARTHPRRNIVTRALGIEPTVKVDSWLVPLVKGDRWMMCSDGLVDEVIDADIDTILAAYADPQEAAEALVEAALDAGGRDNVTVVVLDILDGADPAIAEEIELDPWDEDLPTMIDADTTELSRPGDERFSAADLRIDITSPVPLVEGNPTMRTGAGIGVTATAPPPPTTQMMDAVRADKAALKAARRAERDADKAAAKAAKGGKGVAPTGPKRRRFTAGTFMFALAVGVIATVTIAFVAASIGNRNDLEPPTPTGDTPATTPSISEPTTTSTTPTSTTRPGASTSTTSDGLGG